MAAAEPAGPLAGLSVVDLTRLLPGGFCTMLLADLGADVLKVEDVGAGDYLRWAAPSHPRGPASTRSATFTALNRNKRSLQVDLKSDAGRDFFLRLARGADVVVESFRPGVMERLGIDYERLREDNPGLVYCAISGYGQEGEMRLRPGHDLNYIGLAGVLGLTGAEQGPPVQPAVQVADVGGGALTSAFGIMSALWERQRSGEGQMVDVSMTAGALSWLAMLAARHLCDGEVPGREGQDLLGGTLCYRPYRCRDGWITIGAVEEKFWRAFCLGVGREDLIAHQHDRPGSAAHAAVEEIVAARSREEWSAFGAEHECCIEPVLEIDEVLASELGAEMVVEVPVAGGGEPVRALAGPVRLSRTPASIRGPAPALGEHTREVMLEQGYESERIEALLEAGVVAAGPPSPLPTFRV